MSGQDAGLTRRGLFAGIVGGAAAAAFGRRMAFAAAEKARIVRVESDKVWNGDSRDPQVVALMVNRGVMTLTDQPTPAAAWGAIFKPGMRVGLKINLLGRPLVYTAPEVTDAVAAGVLVAGVKPEQVIVWDRWKEHFRPTRYKFGRGKRRRERRARGHLRPGAGAAFLGRNLPDRHDSRGAHRRHGEPAGAQGPRWLRRDAGAQEHRLRVLRPPRTARTTTAATRTSPRRASTSSPRTRVPLIVMDATEACFDDGPRPADRSRLWRENAIYVATDPVALDVVCRKVIMAKRAERGLPDKTRQSRHIETATRKGLGVGDPGTYRGDDGSGLRRVGGATGRAADRCA